MQFAHTDGNTVAHLRSGPGSAQDEAGPVSPVRVESRGVLSHQKMPGQRVHDHRSSRPTSADPVCAKRCVWADTISSPAGAAGGLVTAFQPDPNLAFAGVDVDDARAAADGAILGVDLTGTPPEVDVELFALTAERAGDFGR